MEKKEIKIERNEKKDLPIRVIVELDCDVRENEDSNMLEDFLCCFQNLQNSYNLDVLLKLNVY
ncbi:hypothetical protein FL857_03320 [Criibacterium bergeronii]|uniref:Uncharacterized protein n=1 Tax=Criibacterium bergeronii TaxID=1871336 RepID=A0A552VC21_9FIRM|nr:hypothetical protein [Criibacterium bergeronii]TRW28034.1 hypothetical protein FL857_03320 [Criibacterium bergeronii]